MIHGQNAVAPSPLAQNAVASSPLAEDEDTTRSIPASPRTSALRGNDVHGTCSRVFFAAASATSPVRRLQRKSSAWANTLLGARGSRQDSWQEEVAADRSDRVRKGRAPEQRVRACATARECVCARASGWLSHPSLPLDARLHGLRPQW